MHRSIGIWAGWLLVSSTVWASQPQAKAAPPGKVVRDLWDAAYLNDERAGYIRTTVRELEKEGKKLYRTTVTLELTLRRFNQTARIHAESGTVETAEGKVIGVGMVQTLAKNQKLVLQGQVQGNQLKVKVSGPMNMERTIPWNDKVVGLYREQELFRDKAVKPGDQFSYLHYEPSVNAVVTIQVAVKEAEEIEVNGVKQQLLRAEAMPDKIMGVQLPTTTFWLDSDLLVLRSQTQMPGFGKLTLIRTSKEIALSPVAPARITDIGLQQLISLNRRIPRPLDVSTVVYRITLPGDAEPTKAVAEDARQQIKNPKGKSFELHVRAVRQAQAVKEAPPPPEEFLQSNYFINSDDLTVKQLARKAVGQETDPWKKAQRIEQWVHQNMKILNFSEAMATADKVARTLQGDCTEHAMLTAAMCRAASIPSRAVLGLVYVDLPKGPVLGYHMWTEVYVKGVWLGLDATLGRGSIGATHIKITDHSWHDTRSLVPLLPIMRVMVGKPAIEVIRVGTRE